MKILAFDTSTNACSVALSNGQACQSLQEIKPMQHTQLILPMIQQLLAGFDLHLKDLDAVAYGCGPGSFTGTRIASSVVQSIAYAHDLPILQISSLAAVAQTAFIHHDWKKILVAMDARMNQVYWGAYQLATSNIMTLVGEEKLSAPQVVTVPDSEDWAFVGNGWLAYPSQFTALPQVATQIDTNRLPHAEAILRLAQHKFKQQAWVATREALPTYLS